MNAVTVSHRKDASQVQKKNKRRQPGPSRRQPWLQPVHANSTSLGARDSSQFVSPSTTPPLRSGTGRRVRVSTLSHFLIHTHTAGSPDIRVPLTHVLSVDVSGSVVDTHILVRNRHQLGLVNLSGSLQEDDAEAAKDWVQDVMTAAYSGA
jgi:hypothetical protein